MAANTLTIRDASGNLMTEAYIGSRTVLWEDRTGPLRSMLDTAIGCDPAFRGWLSEELAKASDREAFLDQQVTVADEYSY